MDSPKSILLKPSKLLEQDIQIVMAYKRTSNRTGMVRDCITAIARQIRKDLAAQGIQDITEWLKDNEVESEQAS